MSNENNTEYMLFIDLHTQGVVYGKGKKCGKCYKWKHEHAYYQQSKLCKVCYDRKWMLKNDDAMKWPIEQHLNHVLQRAHRRSRYRKSFGTPISLDEITTLWKKCNGKCSHCYTKLTFNWHPRYHNNNYAVLDRLETSTNKTYASNSQFLCHSCNTEKGPWDLVDQQNVIIQKQRDRIKVLKSKLKKRKRQYYSDILIK